MASIELVASAADWIDSGTSAALPSGNWTVAANKLVLTGSVVPTWVVDYGPDRLDTNTGVGSVFSSAPQSAFMQKTTGHMVIAATVTAASTPLTDAGVFFLVQGAGFSGSLVTDSKRALVASVATLGVVCVGGTFGFPTGNNSFSGLGFVPWHIPTNQPLAAYIGADVTWSLQVAVYWTDSFLSIPFFWQNFQGQREQL